jgi:hypothetical protein
MDTEAFIRWALDDARTVEERFPIELLVEEGVRWWNARRKIYDSESFATYRQRARERKLNPAYEPQYSEESLRKASGRIAELTQWWPRGEQAIRSLSVLAFLPNLEWLWMEGCAVEDLSPIAGLTKLRKLQMSISGGEDFTPIGRCTTLRELSLGFGTTWPDFSGIGALTELETLDLRGNLLALPRGVVFPKVRRANLACIPLAARNVADLPGLPACEFLTVQGVERLDGIERMPGLRNLTVAGRFRSFEPVASLKELTWMAVTAPNVHDPEGQPRDIAPLARLPKLHYFIIGPDYVLFDMPRDYSPFAEAPALRELVVKRCPPVEMEVAAINAGLPPWDDLFLAPEPRTLPPLRMIVAPYKNHPHHEQEHLGEGETGLIDTGIRQCEGKWAGEFLQRFISEKIGHGDWGEAKATGASHTLGITVESFDVVERFPEILQATREVIARLRHDYIAHFMITLRVKPPEPTPAQKELQKQFQEKQDEWEYEKDMHEREEYLERLHQLELKKQQGEEIDPGEFSPPDPAPYPKPPWETEEDGDEDDNGSGDIAVKKKPDPPPSLWDDNEHPLADNYSLMGILTLDEAWFLPHHRGIAVHLMRREPDVEIPE